jgi:hypothetical protein
LRRLGREHVEADRQELDQQQRDRVLGHRVEDEADSRPRVVEHTVAADRLGDPDRDRDQQRQDQRDAAEHQVPGQVGREQRIDRAVVLVGVAEVAVEQLLEEQPVLRVEGPVEPVLVVELGDQLRRGAIAEDVAGEAPRQGVQEGEGDHRDPDGHDDRLPEAADDVSGHAGYIISTSDPPRRLATW